MIYFIRSNKAVKIGYSDNPYRRLADLQVSNSEDLTVLLVITGGRIKEQELHRQFKEQRIRGEWFKFESNIQSYIDDNIHKDRKYEFGLCYHDFEGDEQITRLRKSMGLIGHDVAKRLGISQQAFSRFENSEKDGSVTVKNMQRIAESLDYKFEYRFIKRPID